MKREFMKITVCTAVVVIIAMLGVFSIPNKLKTETITDEEIAQTDNSVATFDVVSEDEVISEIITSSQSKKEEPDSDTDTVTSEKPESDTDDTDDTDGTEHVVIPYDGVWELILVNRWNIIPEDYTFEVVTLDNGKQIDERIFDALQSMFNDARNQGIYPVVTEAYRSHEDQQEMMQSYIDAYKAENYDEETAKKMAEEYVAIPGTSEHEIGLALDINPDIEYSTVEEVYGWLAENAYLYGFILRYPEGKESITGINYEPWHYRYVGEEYAAEIFESGMCLEEFLDFKQHEFLH